MDAFIHRIKNEPLKFNQSIITTSTFNHLLPTNVVTSCWWVNYISDSDYLSAVIIVYLIKLSMTTFAYATKEI